MSTFPLRAIPSSSWLGVKFLSVFLPLLERESGNGMRTAWAEEIRYRKDLLSFGERDTDIWVSTYSRSGTTWMQMILYQLTQDGGMDFDHLFDVSPWVYYSSLRRKEVVTTPDPRILKSHDPYGRFSHGRKGRYIFVIRDGRDVAVSWFHHRCNVRGYQGTFRDHFEDFLYGKKYNWFHHVREWVRNKSGLPLLLIHYEDLKEQFEKEIQGIASFIDVQLSEALMERVTERCSFEFMKKHEAQLGPHVSHFNHLPGSTFRVQDTSSFLRKGKVGEGKKVLNEEQKDAYRRRFKEILGDISVLERYDPS